MDVVSKCEPLSQTTVYQSGSYVLVRHHCEYTMGDIELRCGRQANKARGEMFVDCISLVSNVPRSLTTLEGICKYAVPIQHSTGTTS